MIKFGLKAIKEGPAGERVVNGEQCNVIRLEYGLPFTGHVADELDQIAIQGAYAKFHRVDGIELPELRLPGVLGSMSKILQIHPLNQPHIRRMLINGASCNAIATQAHIIPRGWAWNIMEDMVATDGPAYGRVSAGENPETVAREYGISPQGTAMEKLRRLAVVTQYVDHSDAQ